MDNNSTVEVFLGDPIEDDDERHVLRRLCADLAARGVRARVYANFYALGKRHRQVDLLIVTDYRCVQAELKCLDVTLPLIGKANGPWRQLLPSGDERSLDRNALWQAREATYAVSDVMRRVASRGEAPGAPPFYRHIDTVVCLHPQIPARSQIESLDHVSVVGYDELVERLSQLGPRPAWDEAHWDALGRQFGVYPEVSDDPSAVVLLEGRAATADYRRRFLASQGHDLHELVSVTAEIAGVADAQPLAAIVKAAVGEQVVTLVGPSGSGKTHTARHAALVIADAGHLPVWVRCAEYEGGRFSVLLKRAAAPYATDSALALMSRAREVGAVPVLVLDGLNECPPQLRAQLLDQLTAARLRLPAGVIITSTEPVPVPESTEITDVRLRLPGDSERQALVSSYGGLRDSDSVAFRTPYELSLAALCASELAPDATTGDLFDAYVRLRTGRSAVRAAVRRLADEMNTQVRLSLSLREATLLLERARTTSDPDWLDTVLACPLLEVEQGRVRISHEQLSRYLVADELVSHARDTKHLARMLNDARHEDLRSLAVQVERDVQRRHDLLRELADAPLLLAAIDGEFGEDLALRVRGDVAGALTEAHMATRTAVLTTPGVDVVGRSHWNVLRPRTELDNALLAVAGISLARGWFIPEMAALLGVTDERCAGEIARLREEGSKGPITEVVAATYNPGWSPSHADRCLPATLLLHAGYMNLMSFSRRDLQEPAPASRLLTATAEPPRWGRLYTALLLTSPDDAHDVAGLPDLVAAAWNACGYHLRLEALQRAEMGRVLDDVTRARLVAVLETFDASYHPFLSSSLVEALAACGALEPMNSLESIRAEINAVLSDPDNPEACKAARSIFYRQFDPDEVVGPYCDAISELDDDRMLRLCVMASQTEDLYHPDWLIRHIANRAAVADERALVVLRRAATHVASDSWMPQEAVRAHLHGLRGWAQLADRLPEPDNAEGDVTVHAWRLLDELLFAIDRGAPLLGPDASSRWQELRDLCSPVAVGILFVLSRAGDIWDVEDQVRPYARFLETYPNEIRELLEWALPNRESLVSPIAAWQDRDLTPYVIDELGRVGVSSTVALLQNYVADPELGRHAVDAIRSIERRSRADG